MIERLLTPIIYLSYLPFGYLVCRSVYRATKKAYWLQRILVRSCTYALLFGIGFISAEKDEFFPTPSPVIFAAIYTHPKTIVENAVLPFVVCWLLILFVLLLDNFFHRRMENNKNVER